MQLSHIERKRFCGGGNVQPMRRLMVGMLLCVVAGGAFAVNLSAGGGLAVSTTSWNSSRSLAGTTVTVRDAFTPLSAKAFFDATYAQVSLGLIVATSVTQTGNTTTTSHHSETLSYLSLAGLLKYPLDLGSVVVFPLFGIEYDLNLSHGSPDYFEGSGGLLAAPTAADYNQLWLKAGVGADVLLGRKLFIRPEVLVGVKPLNPDEANVVAAYQSVGYKNVSLTFLTIDFALLVGYRL